jgi:predicted ATPase
VDVPVEETVWGHSLAVVMGNGAIIPADLVSEGTLLALGLLTLLHDPAAPALILLDDLDRALHLGAQVRLIRTLRAIQQQRPELQLVVSTHSPFMLQEVDAGEVRVMTTDTGGAAHCKGLKQHPDYEKWRTILNTGEIWANLGEDWAGRHG